MIHVAVGRCVRALVEVLVDAVDLHDQVDTFGRLNTPKSEVVSQLSHAKMFNPEANGLLSYISTRAAMYSSICDVTDQECSNRCETTLQ